MIDAILIVYLAVAIPAWTIVLIRERFYGKKAAKEAELRDRETAYCNTELRAPEEEIEKVRALFVLDPEKIPSATEYPQWHGRYYGTGSERYRAYVKSFGKMRDAVLYEYGVAEDLEAIYGPDWETEAEFRIRDMTEGGIHPYHLRFRGFRDPPSGEDLSARFPESEALTALILSHRGVIPLDRYEPFLSIVPFPHADWNRRYAEAWYKRIRDNLEKAGKTVSVYWPREDSLNPHAVWFSRGHSAGERIDF